MVATGHDGGMSTLITTVSGAGGVAPLAILWAPKGEHRLKCSVNGEPGECVVRVSEDCVSRLNADLGFWADEMNAADLGGFEVRLGLIRTWIRFRYLARSVRRWGFLSQGNR